MGSLTRFYRSTVGKKIVMASTGAILVAYIVAHVLGNLLIYRGPAAINAYGAFLKSMGSLLWLARAILLAAVVLHIIAAAQLTLRNLRARPARCALHTRDTSTFAARTMRWGGPILALFIVYHVLHFTTGTLNPAFHGEDIYSNVVGAFRIWWVTAIYLFAVVVLGLHLYHGTWSMFRTLGLSTATQYPLRRRGVAVFATLVVLGFSSIPLAVAFGLLGP